MYLANMVRHIISQWWGIVKGLIRKRQTNDQQETNDKI